VSNAESSKSAPPAYLETFSLRCEPFAERINSRFFYAGTTLMQRLDLLTHLTQFGGSVVLVSGPPGSGKTTLLSRFIGQANSQWRLCLMDAEDDFSQFHNRLTDALGSGSFSSEQELFSQWANHSDSSQLLVVVIDNAEQLDESALERLCALLGQASADRIRIILFGVPDAQQRLKQAFEQKALSCTIQRLEMPRLDEEETSSYLLYRLAVSGYSGESPFSAAEVRAICKAADGRPADINRLAKQALLERQPGTTNQRVYPGIGKPGGKLLAWGLGVLGVLSLAVYLAWRQFYPASGDTQRPRSSQRPMEELPLALPELRPLPAAAQGSGAVGTLEETKSPAPETVAALLEVEVSRERQVTPPAEQPPPDSARPSESVIGKDEVIAVIPAPADTAASDNEAQQKAVPPASPLEQAPATEPASRETVKSATPLTPAASTARTVAVEPGTAQDTLPHRESWLLAQPEASFSLQLLGSRNEKSMADYIRRNKLEEHKAAYYRGHYRGAAWYVLMYGVYPSKQAALEDRDTLPAKVRKNKPWPRSLKSVHTSIREVQ